MCWGVCTQELVSRLAASEAALKENPFNGHPLCSLYYAAQHRRMQMQTKLRNIQTELEAQKKTAIKVETTRCIYIYIYIYIYL